MLEWLQKLDTSLFFLINKDGHAAWADAFFPAITDLHQNAYFKYIFIPWLFIVFIRIYWWKGVGLFLGLCLTIALTDLIGGQVIKPYFDRERPVEVLSEAVARSPHHGGGSFISNHAANTMAAALFCTRFIPQGGWMFLLIPILVGYSRVYGGVHYPSDVLGGYVLGAFIATFMVWLFSWWERPLGKIRGERG